MAPKLFYAFASILLNGFFAFVLCAQAAPAPQTLVLEAVPVDVTHLPTAPGHGHAPVNIHRHFANPSLLGQVKASLAKSTKSGSGKGGKGGGGGGGHGKPTPTPTPTPTPVPTPTPTPTTLQISSGVTTPVPHITKFEGMNLYSGGGYEPPDTTVAAGVSGLQDLVLEAVNSLGAVYTSAGALQVNLNFGACTTNTSTDTVSDPRVLFDADSGTWFISTTTFAPISDASWNLLFTLDGDPTSTNWACLIIPTGNLHNPDGSVGNFPDFPKLGINSDKVVMTGDAFSQIGAQNYKYQGTEFVVIDKTQLLSGTVNAALFSPDQGDFAIEPAQQINSSTGSLYMASINSGISATGTLHIWKITGLPGANLQTSVTSLPIATISYPPNAQQEGTGTLIDTNDDSLLDAVFREGSPGSLWVSANDACKPPGDSVVRSCLRFMKVSIPTSGPMSVAQDFDYADSGKYYYYPAVRTDGAGNLYAAFSGSSTSAYPSAYAAMQLSGNPNALTNLSITRAGDSAYTLSPPRWGDYSGAGVDPDDASVWLGAEYGTGASFLKYWGTSISHVSP